MIKLMLSCLLFFSSLAVPMYGQIIGGEYDDNFTRSDSLRGSLRLFRACFDVYFYNLDIEVNIADSTISGSNDIHFVFLQPSDSIQIDLFNNLHIHSIKDEKGNAMQYHRDGNAVLIKTPGHFTKDEKYRIRVDYSGRPIAAENAPWDGGFVWSKDKSGKDWVGVACQGIGASIWWPNKDHLSDKPDSMKIAVTVPHNLKAICNGQLKATKKVKNKKRRYEWLISYPINNYNVTINIGNYAHFNDKFQGKNPVQLDYYVLPENLEKAKKHFEQVKPMLTCYEEYFGAYPFYKDGYKLIETPYLGMEHQSAIAYGNQFQKGTMGIAQSAYGLLFDFIIIHESGHEWWGNYLSSSDLADMWIHESLTTYGEVLYVECLYGYEASQEYVNGYQQLVLNDKPMQGVYGVNKSGSRDMYYKGALMLNSLRHMIDDDKHWFAMFKDALKEFAFKPTNYSDFTNYLSQYFKRDLSCFFEQYVQSTFTPLLEIQFLVSSDGILAHYYWNVESECFDMPVKVDFGTGEYVWIYPTTDSNSKLLPVFDLQKFRVDQEHFYFEKNISKKFISE
ncbi:MAG: M1 family metallopeptidase [Cyclobacteriaceae bacterium]